MQNSKQIYTIEELRDLFVYELSQRKNIPEEKQILSRFDKIFKETIFSQKALTVNQIEAIVKDSKNRNLQQGIKDTYQILDLTLQKLHKKNKPKEEKQPNNQNQGDEDSFNFDSQQREGQSSQEDVDDDYVNDLKNG